MTVHVGGIEVQLIHPGPAHTAGDSIVHLPDQGIVFTGDLIVNGGTPFMPNGSLRGTLRALDLLRSLDAEIVVPGHGPVTDPSVYDHTEDYLRFVTALATDARSRGRTPLQAAREADLGRYAAWRESERLVANLHRAYAELDGHPEGSPLDTAAVIGEMIEMSGGTSIACHA
jgi:cyclase